MNEWKYIYNFNVSVLVITAVELNLYWFQLLKVTVQYIFEFCEVFSSFPQVNVKFCAL